MKKILSLFFLAFSLVSCGSGFDERLKNEAEQLTKNHCPQHVDDITTLDSVVYDVNRKTFVRYFSLESKAVSIAKENRLAIKMSLLDELKTDATWKRCKDEKINFEYVYSDASNGHRAFVINFTPKDYQEN